MSATYALGHYIEDFDYLGDRGYALGSDFDLNEQNARWCVTPEFPAGTYAYFTTINADGTPAYPYTTGRQYYGSPTGGNSTIAETVTTYFDGGPNKKEAAEGLEVNPSNGDVTLTWSAVEGGNYHVEASTNLSDWTDLAPAAQPGGDTLYVVETGAQAANAKRFYRISRTSLATFDSNGFDYTAPVVGGASTAVAPGGSAARGTTVTLTITLPTSPPLPPATLVPRSITIDGTITGTNLSRPAFGTVRGTFIIPANATTGIKDVVIVFSPPTYTLTNGFTIN